MTNADRFALLEAASLPDEVRDVFETLLLDGQSPSLALVFVTRRAAMQGKSDRAFQESRRRNMNEMHGFNRDRIQKLAESAGISTSGKYYVGGLGKYTDPCAWVSTVDDVKEVCRKKNLTSTGLVEHQGTPVAPPKRGGLAPDLVQRMTDRTLQADPKLAEQVRTGKKKLAEVKEMVTARHGRKTSE